VLGSSYGPALLLTDIQGIEDHLGDMDFKVNCLLSSFLIGFDRLTLLGLTLSSQPQSILGGVLHSDDWVVLKDANICAFWLDFR
jgi:hypothetical protein